MDIISQYALGINSSALTSISLLLHNELVFVILLVALVFISEKDNSRRKIAFASILFILAISIGAKDFFAVKRACNPELLKVECPSSYSFPSIHAAMVFWLMLLFINKPSYIFYFILGMFVSFTRIYLGVHTFEDVVASLVLAGVSFYLFDTFIKDRVGKYMHLGDG